MNEHETRALREMGRDAWNQWAAQVLRSRSQFEQSGVFTLNWFGEAGNEETRLWLKVATADFASAQFDDVTSFDGFIFPGPVNFAGAAFEGAVSFTDAGFHLTSDFSRAQFAGDASFKGAKFHDQAIFSDAVFEGAGDFERAEFLKERNGPLNHGAKFQRTKFLGKADFRSSVYAGSADFSKVQFVGHVAFRRGAVHRQRLVRRYALFSAPAGFTAASFWRTRRSRKPSSPAKPASMRHVQRRDAT